MSKHAFLLFSITIPIIIYEPDCTKAAKRERLLECFQSTLLDGIVRLHALSVYTHVVQVDCEETSSGGAASIPAKRDFLSSCTP